MSYVPGFRYDLFISYASEDNADDWVGLFQSKLTAELARLLGRPFSEKTVYFDRLRLGVGQAYPVELDNAAHDSALLVALLSPSYSASDWCNRERESFQQNLGKGATFAESLAAVRVRPTDRLPQQLADAQHENFVIDGFEEPWPAGSPKFIEKVNHLAAGIKLALQKLRSRTGAVFVGPTLRSDMDLRSRVADYLSEQHFRATPDPPALLDDRTAIQKALSDAACAVHFIGGATDQALESMEDSLRFCPGPSVLFQPFGANLSAAEEEFLAELPPEKYPHRIGPNEVELNKFLQDLLTRTRSAEGRATASLGIVCDPVDFHWADRFRAEDLSVSYPRFLQEKLTVTERIRQWRRMVRKCHGLLFYHGASPEPWLDRIWRMADEEKSAALRMWYLDDPDLEAKRKRRPSDPAYPTGLDQFIAEVRRKAEGQP